MIEKSGSTTSNIPSSGEASRDPQDLLRDAVLESAVDYAVLTMDQDRRVTSWSAGAEALFGWTAAEMIGQSADRLFVAVDREQNEPEKEVALALAEGRADQERWYVRKGGDRFWGGGVTVPLKQKSAGFLKMLRDWSARREDQEGRLEAEGRFQHIANHGPAPLWVTDETGATIFISRSWYEFNGMPIGSGLGWWGWLEAIYPDDRSKAKKAFAKAVAKHARYDVEYRSRRADGAYAWVLDTATPRFSEDGRFLGYVGAVLNIDARKKAEEHRETLMAELQHRVQSTLAIIRLIVRRSAETSETIDDFVDHLEGRIDAFSRIQGVVTRDPTAGVDLKGLICEELFTYGAEQGPNGQVTITGPRVLLPPRSAETVGLVIHELATNGVKYGALSTRAGRIAISWERRNHEGEPWLFFEWAETGVSVGPVNPDRSGFGTDLVLKAIPRSLGGRTSLDFGAEGIRCRIELPLRDGSV